MLPAESQSFWSWYNNFHERPIDTIVLGADKERHPITPEMVAQFYGGCQSIYNHICQIQPDMIFYPLRGAAPFKWVVEEFGQDLNGCKGFKSFDLRLGHTNSVLDGTEFGTKGLKKSIVNADLNNYFGEKPNINNEPTVMMIDEVQSGSSLSSNAEALVDELCDMGLTDHITVIGARDSRVNRERTNKYSDLIKGTHAGISVAEVEMPLFFVDREELLDFQLAPSLPNGKHQVRGQQMFLSHIMKNVDSRELFQNLGFAYLHPHLLKDALNFVYSNKCPHSNSTPNFNGVQRLYVWLEKIYGSEEQYIRKAGNPKIHQWMKEFYETLI